MSSPSFYSQSGIAIGPILFIIALIAILAAAIAAGSGSFTRGTAQEKSKIMAQLIIGWSANIDNAVQKIKLESNYTDSQISFYIPNGSFVYADGTDINANNTTDNSMCTSDLIHPL